MLFQKKYKYNHLILLILILLQSDIIYAQKQILTHYTVDDGLNSNIVYDVVQDKKGFIWFATNTGAVKYDGKFWKNYGIENGLSDNEILKIKKDSEGRLWLFGFNGTITIIDDEKIHNASNSNILEQLNKGFYYRYFFEDNNENIYLSNFRNMSAKISFPHKITTYRKDSSCVFKINNKEIFFEHYFLPDSVCNNLNSSKKSLYHTFNTWTYYSNKMFLSVIDSKIVIIDHKGTIKTYQIEIPSKSNVIDLELDSNKNLIVIVEKKGAYKFNLLNNKYYLDEVFLKNKYVTSSFQDNEGNTWFTTHGDGVYKLSPSYKTISNLTVAENLHENESQSVFVDGENNIWIGHKYNMISIVKNGSSQKFQSKDDLVGIGRIIKIRQHPSGHIIIASDNGLTLYKNKKHNKVFFKYPNGSYNLKQTIKNFSIKKNGDILVVAHESVNTIKARDVYKNEIYAEKISLPEKRVYSAITDNNENLWIGNIDGLLYIKNNEIIQLKSKFPILKNRITDICMANEYLVITMPGYGVLVLKGDKVVKTFTTTNGLLSNYCTKFFVSKNLIYVCSNYGINIIDSKTMTLNKKHFTTVNGLASNQINDIFIKDDRLYAATLNGVSILNLKDNTDIHSVTIPKIYFTKITWRGKDIRYHNNPKLSYFDKYLRFEFISPTFTLPEKVVYRYRLNNNNWIETNMPFIEFNSLEPGNYILNLSAKHVNSDWSDSISFKFSISKPFYKAWWFILITLFLITAIFFYFYNYNIKRIKQEQKLTLEYEQKINQLQIQTLQAIMNPHFIFNSLSAIQQQINVGDSFNASKYLNTFSKLLRKNLETIREEFIAIKDEIERIKLYLETEKNRLGNKLTYNIIIDKDIDINELMIPTMLIQPMIENAIWHGIMPSDYNGIVILRLFKFDKMLKIEIEDNGIGYSNSLENSNSLQKRQHFGISITKERLDFFRKKTHQNFDMQINDMKSKNGTLVIFSLPILEKY